MNTTLIVDREPSALFSFSVHPNIKKRAEEAAALLGQSISDFAEAALNEKVDAVFEQTDKIELSERDYERFVTSISVPKPPTAQLISAMQEYERQMTLEPDGNW